MADPQTDDELMMQYRDGELLAFQELHRRYKSELFRYVWWRTPQAQWVDEIVQDTWANLLKARNRYQPNAAFRVYLYLLARNRLFEMLGEHQHLLPAGASNAKDGRDQAFVLADAMREKAPPVSLFDRQPLRNRWIDAVKDLPSELAEVLILQKFNALSLIEIAEIISVPVGKVRSRLRDAVFALKPLVPGAPKRPPLKPGEKVVNDVDDMQLEAFIRGSDALTLQLRGIEQVEPNPQTEALILKRVNFALEQGAYQALDSEVAEHIHAAPPRSNFGLWKLWPVPVAVTALFIVFLVVQGSGEREAPVLTGGSAVADSAPRMAPTRESDMVAHTGAPQVEKNVAQYPQDKPRVVTGQAVESAAVSKVSATTDSGTANVDKWLDVVNDLLKAGLQYEAKEEFAKFRAVNPDYPVPAAMLAKLNAPKKK
jgi:RNA polymerase sigma factor (sigma-70 family)